MPHTSHKKKNAAKKRKEVVDEEGWTRITSSTSVARTVAQTPNGVEGVGIKSRFNTAGTNSLRPMSPVKGTTPETIRAQFNGVQARWLETELCKALQEVLTAVVRNGNKITRCVMFGSGSFCGDEVHWIDRHESAYNQLAAFKTAVDTISRVQGEPAHAYAQEPCYNDLDAGLLAGLDITKVDHPAGFELLAPAGTSSSFAYSPAAEPVVELEIMSHDPSLWLHRSLEHLTFPGERLTADDLEMTKRFKESHASQSLPELNLKNFPFHGSVIWWRQDDDDE